MSESKRDDLVDALGALPPRDVDRHTAARVRSIGLAAFDAAHGGARARFAFGARSLALRALLPAALFAVVWLYLGWALSIVDALYR